MKAIAIHTVSKNKCPGAATGACLTVIRWISFVLMTLLRTSCLERGRFESEDRRVARERRWPVRATPAVLGERERCHGLTLVNRGWSLPCAPRSGAVWNLLPSAACSPATCPHVDNLGQCFYSF